MTNDPKTSGRKSFIKIGLSTGIFLVLLFLKLGEFGIVKDWSWWWVTSPLWAPLAATLFGILIMGLIVRLTYKVRAKKYERNKELRKIIDE